MALGRAAALVLGERADVLNVRLGGRRERRLAAAVARYSKPAEELRREMEANDRAREAYVRHFYRADASSPKHYHLVVDSTALSLDTVVELVVVAARSRGIGTSEAQHDEPRRSVTSGVRLRCPVVARALDQARTTLPARMHEVQALMRRRLPGAISARTDWMFGFQRRGVRRCE